MKIDGKPNEEQAASEPCLTDGQLAEVRRRRSRNDPNRVSFDEVFERFRPFTTPVA